MSVLSVTKDTFSAEVEACERPVLLDFYATWCGPCRMVSPIVEEIAAENSEVKVCKVDVDSEQELALRFGVTSIPTLVAFRAGKVTARAVGAMPKDAILALLHTE